VKRIAAAPDPPRVSAPGSGPGARKESQPPPPVPDAEAIGQDDIDRLIGRFIDAYQAGDIGRFAALFTADAVTNDGVGVKVVRDGYGGLFEETRDRALQVLGLRWVARGDSHVDLQFRVRIHVNRGLLFGQDDYAGEVAMVVVRDSGRLRIAEFIHQVARQ
jgi:hypothetical protein